MKRILPLLLLAILAGCATPPPANSAGHVVIPANTRLGQTDWVPKAEDIADIEAKLATLLLNPDARISGIGELAPPYPLKDYVIRYTVTGPKDSTFILGEAVHRNRPESATQLDVNHASFDPKKVHGPEYLTFVYDVKIGMIREVLFATP